MFFIKYLFFSHGYYLINNRLLINENILFQYALEMKNAVPIYKLTCVSSAIVTIRQPRDSLNF